MLFNEPKLLKCRDRGRRDPIPSRFSALQRAEIAEIELVILLGGCDVGFSALQRAEIAEILRCSF